MNYKKPRNSTIYRNTINEQSSFGMFFRCGFWKKLGIMMFFRVV